MMHQCKSDHGGPGHPSLFLGPAGSQSGLHADSVASRFWMAVFQGTKWFRLVDQAYAKEHMYPTEDESEVAPPGLSMSTYWAYFEVDTFEPDFERHPKFKEAIVWEANVTAGDIIFIPQTWLHQVKNMDNTIAMSYNYVDEHNFDQHVQWHLVRTSKLEEPFSLDATDDEKAEGEESVRVLTSYAAGDYFPVPYTPKPNRSDELWADFFKRQMVDRFEKFRPEEYDAAVATAGRNMLGAAKSEL